ncbi:MAG: response regulator [Haloarculaceae archaeon]
MTAIETLHALVSEFGGRPEPGTVLVVDDKPHLVGMYAAMLEDRHDVRTATSGESALDALTDEVDVVLLDRRMPGLSGDDVLEIIHEEESDCRVAMVTSVEPEADIVDLPFDAYLVKPVRQRDLHEIVDDLLTRARYGGEVRELLSTAARIAALESQLDEAALATNPEYHELRERQERLEAATSERMDELEKRGDTGLIFRDVLETVRERNDE